MTADAISLLSRYQQAGSGIDAMQRNGLVRKSLRALHLPWMRRLDRRTFSVSIVKHLGDTAGSHDLENPLFNYTSGRWLYVKQPLHLLIHVHFG